MDKQQKLFSILFFAVPIFMLFAFLRPFESVETKRNLRQYDQTVSVPPKPLTPEQEDEIKAKKLHDEGLAFYKKGNFNEALDLWLREAELRPGNANTHNNIGLAYQELGDNDTALTYHMKAIDLSPRFGHAYYSLSQVYLDFKNYDEAIYALKQAQKFNYRPADTYWRFGLAYEGLGNMEKSNEAFMKSVELKPSYRQYLKKRLQKQV